MPRTQFKKMHLFLMVTLSLMYFSEMTAAQSACDPLTQYERNGECCKMCGPGTSMSSLGTCPDPQCTECGDNEYQDKYTKESLCQRQPYCDQFKNFGVVSQKKKSKTTKSTCVCKEGFHCSSGACITCVPHTPCQPGHGAQFKGNHSHNTVCQKCAEGTFSKGKSWDGVCEKWNECMEGYHVEQSGTDVSDNICEKNPRSHTVLIVVGSVIGFLFVICVCWFLCKDYTKEKVKVCVELCQGDKKEPLRETKVLITNPTVPIEEVSMSHDLQCSQDEASLRAPEENEDELSQDLLGFGRSENGNFVTEEDGKSMVLSRQESRTQAFTD